MKLFVVNYLVFLCFRFFIYEEEIKVLIERDVMEIVWCNLYNGFKQYINVVVVINGVLVFKLICDIGIIFGMVFKEYSVIYLINILVIIYIRQYVKLFY